jgi:hypothetical protein
LIYHYFPEEIAKKIIISAADKAYSASFYDEAIKLYVLADVSCSFSILSSCFSFSPILLLFFSFFHFRFRIGLLLASDCWSS